MQPDSKNTPLLLLILDGWGLHPNAPTDNDPTLTKAPYYHGLLKSYPWIPISASEGSVGLPDGQIGNSEVGHLTLGAGRVLYQDLTRIDKAIEDGTFNDNKVFLNAIEHAKTNQSTLHLMGLVSDGGVHSHVNHLLALIKLAKEQGVQKLNVHAFLDGRDVPPRSAEESLMAVEELLLDLGYPQIQTVSGRYYAMDRDNRWDRTEQAYTNLTQGAGQRHFLSTRAVNYHYEDDVTDEFVPPSVTDLEFQGMESGDALIFFNFRPDRARQLTAAMTQTDFNEFERSKVLNNIYYGCMGTYDASFGLPVAYPKEKPSNIFPEVLSRAGLKQFRTAETEKYAHVTYFFNGGEEQPFDGETRELVPSPKVATYDLQPEMSLPKVTDGLVAAIESGRHDVLVANFANSDMVGHTGVLSAAEDAVVAIDKAIERVTDAILSQGGTLCLTADHGNIEQMTDADGNPHTAHTVHQVPFVVISKHLDVSFAEQQGEGFGLSHVAPTLLHLLGLDAPAEMDSSMLTRCEVTSPVG